MPIEITGLDAIQAKLTALSEAVSPAQMKNSMHTIGNMIQNNIEQNFENQSDAWGNPWEKLNAKTEKAKKGRGKILRFEGNLEDKWLVDANSESVTVSGNALSSKGFAYGAVHQWGGKKVVARPFLPVDAHGTINPKLAKDIEMELEAKLLKALG